MRGDWIHDWVLVEMEYRAGPAPVVRERRLRPPSKHWRALWAGLFATHRAPHGSSAAG